LWSYGDVSPDLFADGEAARHGTVTRTVPRSFIDLANTVVWHSHPERFARLYTLLWRVKDRPVLMSDHGDALVGRLRDMEKSVHRCQHKMRAFVRFREVGPPDAVRRSFAAWFEPTHNTVEPTAPFFARRFADMDWCLVTAAKTAVFEDGRLRFGPGQRKPRLPEDAAEHLWSTYFQNIFNPARLKVKAMQSQMPKKYWRNMPEAKLIPVLIADADSRVQDMRNAAPSPPLLRAKKTKERIATNHLTAKAYVCLEGLRRAAGECARCPLYRNATQLVMGEGPADADLMFVGEQPGDQEDLAGRPFVGPAGQLLESVCQSADIDRSAAFVTNAVKHFKFAPRGKRRIHKRPNTNEVSHCKWWLDLERRLVRPRLIVALGATAAEALTGSGSGILWRRGTFEAADDGTPVFLTIHPSYLLRMPNGEAKTAEVQRFRDDLQAAATALQNLRAA
jgi:DNA polymerase